MKKITLIVLALSMMLAACQTDADVASHNVSRAADMFEIERRVVFFNGITDTYLLVIEGRCSLGNNDKPGRLTVPCKVGEDEASGKGKFRKHFLGLSDNVSFFVEQTGDAVVDVYHYRVIFKPETIVPNIDLEISSFDE